jgi:hypothetical protein
MKTLVLAMTFGLVAPLVIPALAHAQSPSCQATAGDKKLAGAALNSFMKKCEADAKTRCDAAAADKKLAGAAKTSFTKKCVSDAVSS